MREISHLLWLQSPVGKELTDGEARELFMISRREAYKQGEKLFDEGDEANALFLLADGEVEVHKRGHSGNSALLARMAPGSILGEMGMLLREPRSSRAVVISPAATVLRVSVKDFQDNLAQNPTVAVKLIHALARVLAGRLRDINQRVADIAERNVNQSAHEQIEEFASFKKKLLTDWSY